MADTVDFNNILSSLEGIIGKEIDLSNVSVDTQSFSDLPDGYYLSEVEKADLTTAKSSGNPMFKLQFKVVEDGLKSVINEVGQCVLEEAQNTKDRKIFKNFAFKDQDSYKRCVSTLLRIFDNEEEYEILKQALSRTDTVEAALDYIVGRRVYIQVSTTTKNGESAVWYDLISWDRSRKLELPQ